jgi:predicted nucleic acid-binding protein
MLQRGAIQLVALAATDVPRMRELLRKFANRPMDLAHAALLRVAKREGLRKIFTVDRRHFPVYRINGRLRPILLP